MPLQRWKKHHAVSLTGEEAPAWKKHQFHLYRWSSFYRTDEIHYFTSLHGLSVTENVSKKFIKAMSM
jgi:hypothetical protein